MIILWNNVLLSLQFVPKAETSTVTRVSYFFGRGERGRKRDLFSSLDSPGTVYK